MALLFRGHRGWGRFTSLKMTTVSRTCRWKKFTCIAVLVTARPVHPSTGQFRGPPVVRKSILYVRGYSPGSLDAQLRPPSAALQRCICMCPASNPSAISSPQSLHWTRTLCRSHYENPSPIIHLLYATSDFVPASWNGRQTMPTVFLTLVRMPTL